MRTLLLAVLLVAVALPLPAVEAYHAECQPGYSCNYEPCDLKCMRYHAIEFVRCVASLQCIV